MTSSQANIAQRLAGIAIVAAVAGFIGWGLWLAYHPTPPPLQGQIEARSINIAPKISARIATQAVREGDSVIPGTLLVTLDSPEVRAKFAQATAAQAAADARRDMVNVGARSEDVRVAKAQWEKALAGAELADNTYKRINALYKEGLVPLQRNDEADANRRSTLETAHAARAQYDMALTGARPQEKSAASALAKQAAGSVAEVDAASAETELKAPFAAEVDKVVLHPGELAPAGFPIMTLVDMQDIWAVFNVREDDFNGIKVGSELLAEVPALGQRKLRLKIYYISPRGDFATWRATRQSSGYDVRTFEVRARPVKKVDGLRPGMSVLVGSR